jgi:hypothetical protein
MVIYMIMVQDTFSVQKIIGKEEGVKPIEYTTAPGRERMTYGEKIHLRIRRVPLLWYVK